MLKQLLPKTVHDELNWLRLKLRNRKNDWSAKTFEWRKNGSPFPVPHSVKKDAVFNFKKRFNINTLVETGTFLGEMIYAQRNNFKQLYSIELSEELFRMAEKRFSVYPHIKILNGDSGKVLNELVPSLNEPALFWLDGHYSGFETAKGESATPFLQEFNAITSSKYRHFILVDDAHLFNGTGDYPTLDFVKDLVKHNLPDYLIDVENNIIRIFPANPAA